MGVTECGGKGRQNSEEDCQSWIVDRGWYLFIDVCERILAFENVSPADTSVGNLERVAELGLLQHMDRYKPMIRFRNFIVHRYEVVDPEILFDIISNRLEDFECFIKEIEKNVEAL